MQTQAQIPGQVPTQPGGNPLPSQGGTSMGGLSRAWHSEGDLAIRRTIMEKILALFQRRKPRASLEWQQKLPDLVKRIEEALYKDAASKEEYEDLSTLEPRLQAVARRLVPPRTNQSFVQPPPHPAMAMPSHPVASMIPTPGIPASNGCTMIPTPGSDISSLPPQRTGMNHMMPVGGNNSSSGGLLQGQTMSSTGKMSSMIPTPGLGSSGTFPASSDVGNNSFNVQPGMKHGQIRPPALMGTHGGMPGLGGSGGGQMIPTPGLNTSQQAMCRTPPYSRIDSGASGHLYRNVNNQGGMGAPPPMRKSGTFGFVNGNTGNGFPLNNNGQQHLMNGNTNYIGSSGYANSSQLGNMQAQQRPAQQQQHLQQQQQVQQHLGWSSGERHSRATVDLTETGSMHDSSMRIGGAGGSSQASKMIPVPGLPPQGNTWLPQQQLEQSNYRQGVSDQRAPVVKNRAPYPSTQLYAPKQPGSGVGGQELDSQLASGSSSEQPMKTQQQQQQQQQQSQTGPQPQHLNTSQLQLQKDKQALIQQAEQQMRETHMSGSDEHNNQVKEEHTEPNNKQDRQSSQGVGVGLNSNEAVSIGNAADEGQRAQQYFKQQKWLLFLRHASKCTAPEGQCHSTPHCHTARQLWSHITQCTDPNCQYARCQASRKLLRHHQQCRDPKCPVCGPVRQILFQQRAQAVQAQSVNRNSSNLPTLPTSVTEPPVPKRESEANQGQHHPAKRLKVENTPGSLESRSVNPPLSLSQENPLSAPSQTNPLSTKTPQVVPAPLSSLNSCSAPTSINVESESNSIKTEPVSNAVKVETASSCHVNQSAVKVTPIKSEVLSNDVEMPSAQIETSSFKTEASGLKMETLSMTEGQVQAPLVQPKAEMSVSVAVKGMLQVKQEVVSNTSVPSAQDNSSSGKPWKPKIKGVSLTELFTPDQIRDHIKSLRQWVGQSRVKAEKNQAMELQMNENSCQLCAVEKLTFEPSPIYCSPCGARIKKNAMFWTHGLGETRHYFCIPCYNEIRTETVEVDGLSFAKSKLEKRKNDEETEEAWVQCDKCEAWQHQICALFNGRRNEGGQAEYMCPRCQIKEIENGERKPLPQSAVLGAKDLPRTQISDFIEQRLARKLKQERLERARAQGKTFDEVPGAEPLVLRVVSCVDKKLEVKSHFLQLFQEEDYPAEFSYRSKALLLFQKIEGVEVCLFGMYVQEFGAECSQPNERRVYLSYLDSVKYFRPDVRTTSGEALRTFVYHEILIGYLDYCKKRGLTSCYIWACPPLKGEDYILYCHPEIQKTPKADKLREWYLMMLRKASNENVVVELTNMYDHFFVCSGESKAKVTAARLPYFEGDYWPGAAEDMIMQLQQEQEDGRKIQKKGKTKKTVTKRSSKAAGHTELSSNSSKDLQLMQKLGESIFPMKEDFIMVHLQYACTHCCNFILSGHRWVCKQCKNFHLCDRCYEVESKLEDRDRHPTNSKEAHLLVPVEVSDVPADTRDKDEVIESEFFDTRQAFLSLCQGNHYQYDTLRRGKHSSIMVLYHLHNPTAPAFVTSCNACHHDIESGQGWRCEICPDYDLCNACHQKEDTPKHPHKLAPHPSLAEHQAQNKEARQLRVVQLRKMLDLLIHASQCFTAQCQYPNCRRVKGLFRHGMNCKIRASGGCPLCKKMWYLLQLHARACKESECRVPRCKDLKEHLRRLQSQMESRRRAAVKEMMRQRAAEAAGSAC